MPEAAAGGETEAEARPYRVARGSDNPGGDRHYDQIGRASWYGAAFHGKRTANGEVFDSAALSAAHPSLPLPSYVRVTNLENERSVIVRVNDRGPYSHSRMLDVSERAADLLGFKHGGMAQVRVQYVDAAPLGRDIMTDVLTRDPAGHQDSPGGARVAAS